MPFLGIQSSKASYIKTRELWWYQLCRNWRQPLSTMTEKCYDDVSKNGNISALLALCVGNSPVNPPPPPHTHKGQWRGALMLSLICTWIHGWVNNREAGVLSRHCAHYDVIIKLALWPLPCFNAMIHLENIYWGVYQVMSNNWHESIHKSKSSQINFIVVQITTTDCCETNTGNSEMRWENPHAHW